MTRVLFIDPTASINRNIYGRDLAGFVRIVYPPGTFNI